jgi:LysM repeat protein
VAFERMFVQDGARNVYPRPQRRRGWGRILLLAAVLVVATGRLAYGSGPIVSDKVVVEPGDTVWSIAAGHYRGDPRPHVEAILQVNHLSSPLLTPGQSLLIPRE